MTSQRWTILLASLCLLAACGPAASSEPTLSSTPQAGTTPTGMPSPSRTATAQATKEPEGGFLDVHVFYGAGMMNESSELSIRHVEAPTPYIPQILTDREVQPLTVVFNDETGQLVLELSLPVVYFDDQMAWDAGLKIEWAAIIPADPRFACVVLQPTYDLPPTKISIEPPLLQCASH